MPAAEVTERRRLFYRGALAALGIPHEQLRAELAWHVQRECARAG